MNEKIKVNICCGYANKPKANVYINEESYVIDIETIEEMLLDMILAKSYTISKTKRQKYPRLIINQ